MNVAHWESNSSKADLTLRRVVRQLQPSVNLHIQYTFNRTTMISFRHERNHAILRLHDAFRSAAPEVLKAIASMCFGKGVRRRDYNSLIFDFIERNRHRIELATYRMKGPIKTIGPEGNHFDLREIFDRVCTKHFRRRFDLDLTWSSRVSRTVMGQWREMPPKTRNLISINRLLDDRRVPSFYMDYLLYHEILHEVLPPRTLQGRKVRHFPEFQELEQRFPYYKEALEWEHKTVGRLYEEYQRHRRRRLAGT